jgi:hypothetical protein
MSDYVASFASTPILIVNPCYDDGINPDPNEVVDLFPLDSLPFLFVRRPSGHSSTQLAKVFAKDCPEPTTLAEACRSPHATQWSVAMQQKFDSL